MKYQSFPRLEKKISSIIFGSHRFLSTYYNPNRDSENVEALYTALERGINVVHSSFEYAAQDRLASFLANRPEGKSVYHFIKNKWGKDVHSAQDQRDFIDQQLSVLKTERIDILQIRDQQWENYEKCLEYAVPLRDEGKIGAIICFVYNVEQGMKALADDRVDGLAGYYNSRAYQLGGLIPHLVKSKKPFIPYQPIQEGLFSDHRKDWESLPEDDRFKNEHGKREFEYRDRLAGLMGGTPQSWTQFAVRFGLSTPGAVSLVTAMNSPEQVDKVLEYSDSDPLSADLFEKLYSLYDEFGPAYSTNDV